jgi:DNA-binding MarR family transcriptional regulator
MDPQFDEFLHVPARLSIVALLAPADWVDFGFLRDTIETSDSALSKQISALASVGYVTVRKDTGARTRRTSVRLTPEGRHAFHQHAAALERIVTAARRPANQPTPHDQTPHDQTQRPSTRRG